MRNTVSIVSLSIAATASFAGPALASAAPQAKQVRYCITFQPSTGTRIHHTDCMTKAQWAEQGVNIDELRLK
jgi:hypothetical protein